jgi:hypothetical protein
LPCVGKRPRFWSGIPALKYWYAKNATPFQGILQVITFMSRTLRKLLTCADRSKSSKINDNYLSSLKN